MLEANIDVFSVNVIFPYRGSCMGLLILENGEVIISQNITALIFLIVALNLLGHFLTDGYIC